MVELALHRGDFVEVRNPREILATLDERGRYEGLPFMPEMIPFCGRRFTVRARADKVCDTVNYSGSRRVRDGVILGEIRCDGSAHGACQAECRIFWKTAWLRRVSKNTPTSLPISPEDVEALRTRTLPYTRATIEDHVQKQPIYRCQNTDLPLCSEHVKVFDPRPYVNEYTSGNVSFGHFLKVTSRAAITEPLAKLGLLPEIHLPGTARDYDTFPSLNLQPGEWVKVKSKEEIARTLTPGGKGLGMWFDREMLPHCGKVYRVRQRISRFIHERNGRMLTPKTPSVTLEGVVCAGDCSVARWFCPREIYPYWREFWLERVTPSEAQSRPKVMPESANQPY